MPTIKKGDKGEAVKQLQAGLQKLGYDVGEADGAFGAMTAASLRCFQADHGLVIDAICGTKTWAALNEALNALEMVQDEPTETPEDDPAQESTGEETRPTTGDEAVIAGILAKLAEMRANIDTLTIWVTSLTGKGGE